MRRPGSVLRLSHPAIPAPPLTLGVRHLSGGAAHPCSGRLTCTAGSRIRPRGATFGNVSGLRFACIPAPLPRGRAVGLGARHLSCGDSHCARGDRHLSCGAAHSLCVVPVLPVRLNACALTIPIAGRCPRPDGLPQQPGPLGRNSCSFAAWGARRAPSVARQPVRPTPFP